MQYCGHRFFTSLLSEVGPSVASGEGGSVCVFRYCSAAQPQTSWPSSVTMQYWGHRFSTFLLSEFENGPSVASGVGGSVCPFRYCSAAQPQTASPPVVSMQKRGQNFRSALRSNRWGGLVAQPQTVLPLLTMQMSHTGWTTGSRFSLCLQTSASSQPGRSQVATVHSGPGSQWRPGGQPNCRFWLAL